jgi:hypothetical protein
MGVPLQRAVTGRHGAAYFDPDEFYSVCGFCCQHSHRDRYHIRDLLEFLGVRNAEARHKSLIRVVAVKTPPLTPSPPHARPLAKTVTQSSNVEVMI